MIVCALCTEPIKDEDYTWMNPEQAAHVACSLREVVGGIGHQLAHEYWCLQKHDPNAGLTHYQSARLVGLLAQLVGIEEVAARA